MFDAVEKTGSGGRQPQRPPPSGAHLRVQKKCRCGDCASCDQDRLRIQRFAFGSAQPRRLPDERGEPGARTNETNDRSALTGLIVDDSAPVGSGQIARATFLARIRDRVVALCDTELAAVGRTSADCPYIDEALARYGTRSAAHIERAVRLYTGAFAATPEELIEVVASRARAAARTWVGTGKVTGLPSETGTEGAPATAPATADDPVAIRARLGSGESIPSETRQRMERGFGRSFGHVRVHDDGTAAALSTAFGARAFTVGDHIAFGSEEYRPGTLSGEALLAHELAHTLQQRSGRAAARYPDDAAFERSADRAAVGAMASAWGSSQMFNALVVPQERAGLHLQRCSDKPNLGPGEWTPAEGAVPDYGAILDPSGNVPEKNHLAFSRLMANPEQVDRVYEDAARGDERAKAVVVEMEKAWSWLGEDIARREARPHCLAPVAHELSGAIDPEYGCIVNWGYLDKILSKDRHGGIRLREVTAEAYSRKSRELGVRNQIIVNALNLVLAGWAARSALAKEATALGAKPTTAGLVVKKPDLLKIPEDLAALKAGEAAKRLSLPDPPAGYYWSQSGGRLTVVRKPTLPGEAKRPKLVYDPESRAFKVDPTVRKIKPAIVPPSAVVPAELEEAANKAIAARDALKDVPVPKTDARAPDGTTTRSGYGSDVSLLDPVKKLSEEIGHPLEEHGFDRGQPGSYFNSHAEKKLAAMKPGEPIGVSSPMCLNCQAFFSRLARHTGKPIVVADPAGVRIFLPNGVSVSGVTAAAATAAAVSAVAEEPEEE